MAQRRRREQQRRKRQRVVTALCVAGGLLAVAASVGVCLLVFGPSIGGSAPASAPVATALPYSSAEPFTVADLTAAQLAQLRTQGRMNVSDGPRGVSVGDSLDTLISRFPTSFKDAQPEDEQILYCADYFEGAGGIMTALPPRGLLTADSSNIYVTLLAPTSAYPAGTRDNFDDFEHVYCQFTIEPDAMTVRSIVLGLEN